MASESGTGRWVLFVEFVLGGALRDSMRGCRGVERAGSKPYLVGEEKGPTSDGKELRVSVDRWFFGAAAAHSS